MTNQEFFDKTVAYARTMTERSIDLTPTKCEKCVYKSETGNMCFIGFHMQRFYTPLFEGKSFRVLTYIYDYFPQYINNHNFKILKEYFKDLDVYFVQDLQNIHDNSQIPEWENEFEKFAQKYNLKFEVKKFS